MVDRKLRVFLCHASQDKPVVHELCHRLNAEGWIEPWLDKDKILPGQQWQTIIEEAVEDADVVIVALSNHSVYKEGFVQRELRYAAVMALEKPEDTIFLIPVRIENCLVPRSLRDLQWMNYFGNEEEISYSYNSLLQALNFRHQQVLAVEQRKHAHGKTQDQENEQPRLQLILNAARSLENIQRKELSGPRLLNYWGGKGVGKTTLLKNIAGYLRENNQVNILQMLDLRKLSPEEIRERLTKGYSKIDEERTSVILLDNIDELLRKDRGSFFDFERSIILPLLERGNTLIITSSQVELNHWSEYEVRFQQTNYQIPPLTMAEIVADAKKSLDISLGIPQVAYWYLQNPSLSEKEIADKAFVYFLEGITEDACAVADIICLLPIFNVYLLQTNLTRDNSKGQVDYLHVLEWIKQYVQHGLIYWDVSIGSYRFTDSAVRRLLARQISHNKPELFCHVQRIASDYFILESKSPGYLHMHLVSAVYHLAKTLSGQPVERAGAECLDWIRSSLSSWHGARWSEVFSAWNNGAGDTSVREEIGHIIGSEYFDAITREIEQMKNLQNV